MRRRHLVRPKRAPAGQKTFGVTIWEPTKDGKGKPIANVSVHAKNREGAALVVIAEMKKRGIHTGGRFLNIGRPNAATGKAYSAYTGEAVKKKP